MSKNIKNIKVVITIDQKYYEPVQTRAEFIITECIFTDFNRLINVGELIETLKKTLKRSDGFEMLTIDATIGENYSNRTLLASYRFKKSYDNIEMAMASPRTSWTFQEWNNATTKDIYKYLKVVVETANNKFIESVRESGLVTN